jgi:hypothetical protein
MMRETELKALNWFEANKLNLNHEKTTKMVFTTSSSSETPETDNVSQTKFLGYNSFSNEITALPRDKFITRIKTLLIEGAYYD